ncbi:unnamed protein product [Dovyalis caffra]|uniref:Uncharacterized protein n=1 Tax=Dovyalis caffra TaxID=77055 RepID=A0AAV1R593_9ROSI|nr:unnamed protein product [Dovyalis caffra]
MEESNLQWSSPPGSMGLPLIGKTLHLIIPSYSLDLNPFVKKRIQRPIVISTDPELNHLILRQEGRLVETWHLDTFSRPSNQDSESRTSAVGVIHKYIRNLSLTHFGVEGLKQGLLPQIEDIVKKTLLKWST